LRTEANQGGVTFIGRQNKYVSRYSPVWCSHRRASSTAAFAKHSQFIMPGKTTTGILLTTVGTPECHLLGQLFRARARGGGRRATVTSSNFAPHALCQHLTL
jgi:hypothetical protein